MRQARAATLCSIIPASSAARSVPVPVSGSTGDLGDLLHAGLTQSLHHHQDLQSMG